MSNTLGMYSFLPWLRRGLANLIVAGASENGRAVVNVDLKLDGAAIAEAAAVLSETVSRKVALFGPGDIEGIVRRAVIRVEPHNWITNFEPNYVPCIEFYPEDFAWRYSPLAPDGDGRLTPWLALIVLEEREQNPEFKDGSDVRNKPLPYVEIDDPENVFPPASQLWAWAHVHVNRSLAANDTEFVSADMAAVIPKLEALLAQNPDLAYSRIVSPRKLGANKAYHAFLMPSFESGRRAGLGLDPHADPALPAPTTSAWADYPGRPEPARYPYYYRWYFRTGGPGDFESLVRLLQPKVADYRVGRRDMDVQNPGSNVRGVQVGRADLGGVLKLGGALKVPDSSLKDQQLAEMMKYENWATPFPQPIQKDLSTQINLADDYDAVAADAANKAAGILDETDPSAGDPDPIITAPFYGTWHAMQKRLLFARDGAALSNQGSWVHEINLDPRFRVTAGLGTRVVQDNQEQFMDAAWEQIGPVLEANRRIRFGQLAVGVSTIWYDRHLLPLAATNQQGAMLMIAPLNKRVLYDGVTVYQHQVESHMQPALTAGALRRVARPRGRLVQSLPFTPERPLSLLLKRVNNGKVSAAPPRETPQGAISLDKVLKAIEPRDGLTRLADALRRHRYLSWILLPVLLLLIVLLFLAAPSSGALAVAVAVIAAVAFAYRRVTERQSLLDATRSSTADTPPPESIDELPKMPDFAIHELGAGGTPRPGAIDGEEASRFKMALKESYVLLRASAKAGAIVPKKELKLDVVVEQAIAAIEPQKTIPRRVLAGVSLPPRIRAEIGESFIEAMAYPVIDMPMYESLKNISSELFLPNIHLVEQNSVTLLETNQRFIESYMVGVNHEFARELLWREYPTDQRGSYFRQFWDPSGYLDTEGLDLETLREKLRDIPPLDRWKRSSKLGSHDHRETSPGASEEEVVLVIRGELLKRYPTAVIYAHKARWQMKDGKIDLTQERRLVDLSLAEEVSPPRSKVLTPLYEAKVDPDIFFFGFDLTITDARGGTGEPGNEKPGWFFIIKERPGEPRFGFDNDKQPSLNVWNDLSWADVQPGDPGAFIQINQSFALVAPPAGDEKEPQYNDDKHIAWNPDMSAAEVAYVLFQTPMLVALHASEMLPKV